MNDFEVLARLVEAFGDRLRVTRRYYQFHLRFGATIYVRRRFPAGFENLARFRETALRSFPNGKELDSYMAGEDVPSEQNGRWDEYMVGPEHIEDVIAVLLDGLDLSEDWVEAA